MTHQTNQTVMQIGPYTHGRLNHDSANSDSLLDNDVEICRGLIGEIQNRVLVAVGIRR